MNDLVLFIDDVRQNYNTGYGTAPRAIAQAAVAVADYMLSDFGCTGFQASCCMWDIVRDLMYPNNKLGFKMIDYDNLLYPQYEYKFSEKTLSKEQWEALQGEARKNLSASEGAHSNVIRHWESIVSGQLPFGFSLEE